MEVCFFVQHNDFSFFSPRKTAALSLSSEKFALLFCCHVTIILLFFLEEFILLFFSFGVRLDASHLQSCFSDLFPPSILICSKAKCLFAFRRHKYKYLCDFKRHMEGNRCYGEGKKEDIWTAFCLRSGFPSFKIFLMRSEI